MSSFYSIPGPAGTIQIGTVTTVGVDDPATITNTGTAEAAILNFEIPRGLTGTASGVGPGSAQAPSISISESDLDTGFYSPGANQLAVVAGGTVALSIGSNGAVSIPGDLTVQGTTTTLNTETLIVKDKNVELGATTQPTDITALGGGITLRGATDKTLTWQATGWNSSESLNLAAGKQFLINNVDITDDGTY